MQDSDTKSEMTLVFKIYGRFNKLSEEMCRGHNLRELKDFACPERGLLQENPQDATIWSGVDIDFSS